VVPQSTLKQRFAPAMQAYGAAAPQLQIRSESHELNIAQWLARELH